MLVCVSKFRYCPAVACRTGSGRASPASPAHSQAGAWAASLPTIYVVVEKVNNLASFISAHDNTLHRISSRHGHGLPVATACRCRKQPAVFSTVIKLRHPLLARDTISASAELRCNISAYVTESQGCLRTHGRDRTHGFQPSYDGESSSVSRLCAASGARVSFVVSSRHQSPTCPEVGELRRAEVETSRLPTWSKFKRSPIASAHAPCLTD